MKLLPKSKINERVNEEKRQNILAGVFLAKKVDALREELLTLQKTRDEFIAGSQQVINDSLSSLQQKQESLSKEIKELEVKRKELLKPLDEEWNEVNKLKAELLKDKESDYSRREYLKLQIEEVDKERIKIDRIVNTINLRKDEIEKAKENTMALEKMAKYNYEISISERDIQTKEYEKLNSELKAKIDTYENGISVNETKEKDLEIREVALLSEQKHLESQQRTLKIAYEEIKKNANRVPNNRS